jgi:hypothetical protein
MDKYIDINWEICKKDMDCIILRYIKNKYWIYWIIINHLWYKIIIIIIRYKNLLVNFN